MHVPAGLCSPSTLVGIPRAAGSVPGPGIGGRWFRSDGRLAPATEALFGGAGSRSSTLCVRLSTELLDESALPDHLRTRRLSCFSQTLDRRCDRPSFLFSVRHRGVGRWTWAICLTRLDMVGRFEITQRYTVRAMFESFLGRVSVMGEGTDSLDRRKGVGEVVGCGEGRTAS